MEHEEEQFISKPQVLEKYLTAGKIVNIVLAKLLTKVVVGAKVIDLCYFGDRTLYEELHKVFNKKGVFKGLAFPTCISVNEIVGHFTPLAEESTVIKEGDLVKIDLGAHIDGFPAIIGHTVVVRSNKDEPVTGPAADVVLAAYHATQAAIRLLTPGRTNTEVTEHIQKICDAYEVNPVEGVLSHEMAKHLIDGNRVIINKQTQDQRVNEFEFGVNDVFDLEVVVSTGEGKPKASEARCTLFKRALGQNYNLRIKQSRSFFNDVMNRHPSFCFSLNGFEDTVSARLGVKECLEHDLLIPFPVLTEKPGKLVAKFRTTVTITKQKTNAICGLQINEAEYKTEKGIKDPAIQELLAKSLAPPPKEPKEVKETKEAKPKDK